LNTNKVTSALYNHLALSSPLTIMWVQRAFATSH